MPKRKDGSVYWRSSDGREMAIADMDDKHLANTVNMLERRAGIQRFNKPENYGWMSVEELATKFYPEYPHLVMEARKRKLLL